MILPDLPLPVALAGLLLCQAIVLTIALWGWSGMPQDRPLLVSRRHLPNALEDR